MDPIQPRQISVVEPIGAAIEKTKKILFQPFDLSKWFAIGFCAWLAMLGNGGFRGNFNFGGGGGGGGSSQPGTPVDFQQELQNFKDVILTHLPVIISIAVIVALIVVGLSLVFMWLRSRGQFMFLYCVAENRGEVVFPWKQFAPQANSLFLFRVVLWVIGAFIGFALAVPLVLIIISFAETDFKVFAAAGVIPLIFIVLGFILMGIVFGVIKTLITDFVVPVMYLEGCTFTEGWKRFWALCKVNKGVFFLFLLFLIVVNFALGMIAVMAIMAACCMCCVGIIFFLPYIGTVAMLPLLVWRRAYSAIFLSQFGPEYNVFRAPPEPVVAVPMDISSTGPVTEGGDLPPQSPEQNF